MIWCFDEACVEWISKVEDLRRERGVVGDDEVCGKERYQCGDVCR